MPKPKRIAKRTATALISVSCLATIWAESASAQQVASNVPSAEEVTNDGIVDIVVTAQRRSERLQDVPIAVSAVSGEDLETRGIKSTSDLIAAVPSVTLLSTLGYLQPRVRGIGNTIVSAGYENGVAVYIDGVYQFSPQSSLFSLANIERVEVLKGPQGTLFGRNATGGLIQVITRKPSETMGGTVSLGVANYETVTADAYVTGPLAPGIAASFTAHVETQGKGWGRNEANSQDAYRNHRDSAARLAFLLTPSETTEINLTADYSKSRTSQYASTIVAPGTGFPFPGYVPATKKRNINSDIQPLAVMEAGGIHGQINQDLGFASLVSITAYRQSRYHLLFEGDASNVPLIGIDIIQPDRQFSQELQLTSPSSSPLKWVIGAFYFDASSTFDPNFVSLYGFVSPGPFGPAGFITGASTFATLGTKSLAGYGQATIPLSDATNLTLGVRYTKDKKAITDVLTFTHFSAIPAPVPGAPVADRSVTYNRPTWRASLDHRFSPELMVYASYNRGFKSGGFNGGFPTDDPFRPEKIDAFEIGAKGDLFDSHLRFSGAAFLYDYKNIQVGRFVGNTTSFYNGAAARTYGFDLDFEAKFSDRFSLNGGLTVLHDRFTDFPNAIISTQVPTGIVVTTGSAKGNRLPLNADFSASVAANYRVPIGTSEIGFDASYTYNDGYFTQPDNILRQPSYNLLAAGISLALDSGLTARIWGRNLLNEDVFGTLLAGTFASNANYQAPRTFGFTITGSF